uniref:von Willebrand factor type A n=1 Tax=Chlorobium phaeobacteroides (strain BS1) TaxID=331678 RepID=B3EKP9_CHLPB
MGRVIGTVLNVNGTVYVRSEDGSTRTLKPGDKIYEGEVLITAEGGSAELQMPDGSSVSVDENREIGMTSDFVEQSKEIGRDRQQEDDGYRYDPLETKDSKNVDDDGAAYNYVQHGYLRVEKTEAPPDSPDYRFVSIVGSYNSSLEGRSGSGDPMSDGRATHDPRIELSLAPPDREAQEEVVRVFQEFEGRDRRILDTQPEIGTPEDAIVDEDDLPEGNDPLPKDPVDVGGLLSVIPGDEPIDTFFEGNSPPAGLTSGGESVNYYVSSDGYTLIGYTGDLPASGIPDADQQVFEVVINNPDSQTGEQSYTYTQIDQLDHPDGEGENNLVLTFTFTAQDTDGDSASSSFDVTVIDDVPVAEGGEVSGYVDEDELPTYGITDNDTEDTTWDSTAPTGGLGSGSLGDLFTIGADQPGSFAFKETADGDPVRTSGGEDVYSQDRQVFYDYESDTVLYGRTAGGEAIFKIEITDQETGDYEFTLLDQLDHPAPAPGDLGDDQVMELSLTDVVQAFDYDKDPVDAAGTFIIKVEDDVPELSGETVVGDVWEDALSTSVGELSDGISDNDGEPESTTASSTSTGVSLQTLVSSGADEPVTFSLDQNAVAPSGLESKGQTVTYSVNGDTLTASAGGREVFTLQVESDGDWTFHLNDQLDHSGQNDDEELLTLDFTGVLVAKDADGDSVNFNQSGLFTINVENDTPTAIPVKETATATPIDTNLLIILDTSGSMGSNPGVSGYSTRMAVSVDAAKELIDQYDALGEVKVRIVDFDSTGTKKGSSWQTATAAKSTLDTMVNAHTDPGQLTNYDQALNYGMDAYDDSGALTDAQGVSYFISDGVPTTNTNWNTYPNLVSGSDNWPDWGTNNGINSNEEGGWESWLEANDVISYAIGMGTGVNVGNLNPVAYNGVDESEMNGVSVPDLNDLDDVLADTIPQDPLTGSLQLAIGADEVGYVKSIAVNGTTYTYNPAGGGSITVSGGPDNSSFDTTDNILTVNTDDGAIIKIDMDSGDYEYKAPAILDGQYTENIGFALVDSDGDTNSSSLVINNYPLPSPINETWIGDGTSQIKTASSTNAYLDGQGGDDTLTGSTGDDILKGGDGNDELDGDGGSDILLGYHGADMLYYDGADKIIDGGNGGGDDMLLLNNNDGITFGGANPVVNIEIIDLTTGNHALSNLNPGDVLDMTDGYNELYILGDSSDSVSGSGWNSSGSGGGYDVYTAVVATETVTLYVQDSINDTIT